MKSLIHLVSGSTPEVIVLISVALLALTGAAIFIFFLFASRQVKNKVSQKANALRARFQESLNMIMLMSSSADEPAASSQFYFLQLMKDMGDSRLAKQVMTDQLIGLKKSLLGSAAKNLTNVFKKLKLDVFSQRKAGSIWWPTCAQGIFELAQMDEKESLEKIKPHLNSKNATVREEAFMALVKLDTDNSLYFLNDYQAPISRWMEMRIHQHLVSSDKRNLPDFSQWFNHANLDVALFSINMARQFKQLNSVNMLKALINDPQERKASLAIEALGEFEAYEAADVLMEFATQFWDNEQVSARLAKSMGKVAYAERHWKMLSKYLTHSNYAVRFEAAQSLHKSGNIARQFLAEMNSNLGGALDTLTNHMEDPLLQF